LTATSIRERVDGLLLVTSGIVLALAFLMSILSGDAIVTSLQQWQQSAASSSDLTVRQEAQKLEALLKSHGLATESGDVRNSRVQTRWVVALALLVAFVGILNAMLMSVTERFREIGTMKCLGALDSFIVKLFLIESVFQGGAGTLAGVVLGLLLNVIGVTSVYGSFAWKMFPYGETAIAGAICLGVGVVLTVGGAVYPAWRAARMHPIEAMRVEA
jgi:predicted lysophospholipase L1 biosynthesis ABC-type transport system permease subunit